MNRHAAAIGAVRAGGPFNGGWCRYSDCYSAPKICQLNQHVG